MTPDKLLEDLGFVKKHGKWYFPTMVGHLPMYKIERRGTLVKIWIDGILPTGRVAGGEVLVDLEHPMDSILQLERIQGKLRKDFMIAELSKDALRNVPPDLTRH